MDSDLLRAAKAGDAAAFDTVWRWCAVELRRFFQARTSRDTAADLAQRASIDLLKKFSDAPEDPVSFGRWVRGYGRNIERRWRREVGRYSQILTEYADQGPSPLRGLESAFGAHEKWALIDDAIARLPSPYRSTLRLFNEGYNNAAIAAELGIAEPTVRWRLMKARHQLSQLVVRSPAQPQETAS